KLPCVTQSRGEDEQDKRRGCGVVVERWKEQLRRQKRRWLQRRKLGAVPERDYCAQEVRCAEVMSGGAGLRRAQNPTLFLAPPWTVAARNKLGVFRRVSSGE
ncbi:hypothetical protein U1Q18_023041, partial [Sarracenia purpurea var. burkii]